MDTGHIRHPTRVHVNTHVRCHSLFPAGQGGNFITRCLTAITTRFHTQTCQVPPLTHPILELKALFTPQSGDNKYLSRNDCHPAVMTTAEFSCTCQPGIQSDSIRSLTGFTTKTSPTRWPNSPVRIDLCSWLLLRI